MKSLKIKRTIGAGAVLGLLALFGLSGAAMATPILTIVDAANNPASDPTHKEVIGDPGGTNHGVGYGTFNGPGVPTAGGGWPAGPGFAADPSFGGALGTSGWHASYLNVSKDADVTFQFMGKGDASLVNHFYLDTNMNGLYEASEELFRSGTTTSCAMFGGTTPSCDKTGGGFGAGQNEYTFSLKAGRISFAYLTGAGVLLENSGAGNGNPDTKPGQLPGYFLGVDPYLATGTHQTSGSAVYAGLSDSPSLGDHDFQDLGVRISVVPEPSGIALAFAGLAGLAYSRRSRKA